MISPDLKLIIDQAPLMQRQVIGFLPGSSDVQIRSGQVIELIGPHSQGWAVRLFASLPNARVGWVCGQALDLCPMALAQSGLPLSFGRFRSEFFSRKHGCQFAKAAACCRRARDSPDHAFAHPGPFFQRK